MTPPLCAVWMPMVTWLSKGNEIADLRDDGLGWLRSCFRLGSSSIQKREKVWELAPGTNAGDHAPLICPSLIRIDACTCHLAWKPSMSPQSSCALTPLSFNEPKLGLPSCTYDSEPPSHLAPFYPCSKLRHDLGFDTSWMTASASIHHGATRPSLQRSLFRDWSLIPLLGAPFPLIAPAHWAALETALFRVWEQLLL